MRLGSYADSDGRTTKPTDLALSRNSLDYTRPFRVTHRPLPRPTEHGGVLSEWDWRDPAERQSGHETAGILFGAGSATSGGHQIGIEKRSVARTMLDILVMSRQIRSYVGLVVLFTVSFLAFNWKFGYVFAIQVETNDCFFMFGRQFLLGFFDHPAGLLNYAGRFLGQFYHYRWLGALLVGACVLCFGVLFCGVLAKLRTRVHVSQTLFPCVLLLALHASTVLLIHDTLGLCASCGVFLGYLSFRAKVPRRVYAVAATPIIYLLLGFYAWFFVAWVVAFEWLDGPPRSGLLFKIAYVVYSIAVPLVAWRWVFPVPLRSALLWPLVPIPPFRGGVLCCSFENLVTDVILGVVLSVSLFLIPFWGRLSCGVRLPAFLRTKHRAWFRAALAIALPASAILLLVIRYDPSANAYATCRHLYKHEQWDALLEEAKKGSMHLDVQFMTNYALCKKRRLLEEMFNYPQTWGTRGLILNFSGSGESNPAEGDTYRAMCNSDLFYEMGHINLAFRHAYNAMHAMGETYDILKRMAQCSMVNGNYAMAAKYLNMLGKTLFHQEFARRYMAIIADPAAVEKEFGDLRRRYPDVDVSMRQHLVLHVRALLTNKDNPMAFDYLTAWLLLEKTKNSIVAISENIDHFKRAGYVSIPKHCQEVLLLWERQEHTSLDLRGYSYDETVATRVDQFLRDLSRCHDRHDAPRRLRAQHGETYMYYCFCVPTPAELGRLTPARNGPVAPLRQE